MARTMTVTVPMPGANPDVETLTGASFGALMDAAMGLFEMADTYSFRFRYDRVARCRVRELVIGMEGHDTVYPITIRTTDG